MLLRYDACEQSSPSFIQFQDHTIDGCVVFDDRTIGPNSTNRTATYMDRLLLVCHDHAPIPGKKRADIIQMGKLFFNSSLATVL